MIRIAIAVAVSLGLAVAAFAAPAAAQYPPPTGACELFASVTAVDEGGSTEVTATVRDVNGNTVPNATVTVSIVSQPGGATLSIGNKTDANGQVKGTLTAGAAGTIVLKAVADNVECGASAQVLGGEVEPEIALPNTGTGAGETSMSKFALAATGLLEVGALLVVFAMVRRRHAGR